MSGFACTHCHGPPVPALRRTVAAVHNCREGLNKFIIVKCQVGRHLRCQKQTQLWTRPGQAGFTGQAEVQVVVDGVSVHCILGHGICYWFTVVLTPSSRQLGTGAWCEGYSAFRLTMRNARFECAGIPPEAPTRVMISKDSIGYTGFSLEWSPSL